ncbi:Imm59 family immunity protein [Streptococcus acidominimus]|nr:Imm59 family immunity protein [Streptococcus acidominimus]
MEISQIEQMKQDLSREIQKKGYMTLKYVLFNEADRTPFAIHIFYKDGDFMVNSRDDRACVYGKAFIFSNFQEAKLKFLSILDFIVREGRREVQKRGFYMYSSPLWDKTDD